MGFFSVGWIRSVRLDGAYWHLYFVFSDTYTLRCLEYYVQGYSECETLLQVIRL
jgi:hypothetical protein